MVSMTSYGDELVTILRSPTFCEYCTTDKNHLCTREQSQSDKAVFKLQKFLVWRIIFPQNTNYFFPQCCRMQIRKNTPHAPKIISKIIV